MPDVVDPEIIEPDHSLPADLVAIRNLARTLDSSIPIPGTRRKIGLAPIIGLVPGFGDILSAVFSSWIVIGAIRHRVPTSTLVRMIANILVDVGIGSIPVIGDIFDFFFQENLGNVELLLQKRNRTRPPRSHSEVALTALVIVGSMIFLAVFLAISAIAGFVWLIEALHASIMG